MAAHPKARDKRVRFERATYTRNALNEPVPSGWRLLTEVFAEIDQTSDGERSAGAQAGRVVTARITCRWNARLAALTGEDQAVAEDVIYDIVGKKEIGRRQDIEISVAARPDLRR